MRPEITKNIKQTAAIKQNNKSKETANITEQKIANGITKELGNNKSILRKAPDLLRSPYQMGRFYTAFFSPF